MSGARYTAAKPPSRQCAITAVMSYTISLWCGCTVYVSCHPRTNMAHTRVIEARGPRCPERRHRVGARLWLWEMLPDPRNPQPAVRPNASDR